MIHIPEAQWAEHGGTLAGIHSPKTTDLATGWALDCGCEAVGGLVKAQRDCIKVVILGSVQWPIS